MLLPFCLDLFVQNILFYIKEADLSIFLEFQELPNGDTLSIKSLLAAGLLQSHPDCSGPRGSGGDGHEEQPVLHGAAAAILQAAAGRHRQGR